MNCSYCGKELTYQQKFCSRKCMSDARIGTHVSSEIKEKISIKTKETMNNISKEDREKTNSLRKQSLGKKEIKEKMRNSHLGKKYSEETKKKMSNSRKGRKLGPMSEEHRKKISDSLKNSEIPRKHCVRSQETRDKISKKLKEYFLQKRLKSKIFTKSFDTQPELIVCDILSVLNISFKTQEKLFYVYDIFLPNYNSLILVNGDFWHCNPNKYSKDFLHPVLNITAEELWNSDNIKKAWAQENGYKIFEIWESDLRDRFLAISKIYKFLQQTPEHLVE